jgi:hypothetical protein
MEAGLNSTPEQPTPAGNSHRIDTLTNLILLGSSFAGGGTLLYAIIGLIRDQPDRAFALLQKWGPWFFLAFFVTWIVYKLLEPVVTAIVEAFGRISASTEKQAESMGLLAAAVQKSADKDDRQVQEMQTLTALTAQRSEKTYAMMQEFHQDNQAILREYGETLKRIEQKVDRQTGEKSTT